MLTLIALSLALAASAWEAENPAGGMITLEATNPNNKCPGLFKRATATDRARNLITGCWLPHGDDGFIVIWDHGSVYLYPATAFKPKVNLKGTL